MTDLAIAIAILREMDEQNGREFWWNIRHVGILQANICIAKVNGIEFSSSLIEALARGEEEHPLVLAFKEKLPEHYKYLNNALDDIYEHQPRSNEPSV